MTNDKNEIDEIAIPILKRILTDAQDKWLDENSKFQNEGLKKDEDYNSVLFSGIAPANKKNI